MLKFRMALVSLFVFIVMHSFVLKLIPKCKDSLLKHFLIVKSLIWHFFQFNCKKKMPSIVNYANSAVLSWLFNWSFLSSGRVHFVFNTSFSSHLGAQDFNKEAVKKFEQKIPTFLQLSPGQINKCKYFIAWKRFWNSDFSFNC